MIEIFDSERYKIHAVIKNLNGDPYAVWIEDYFCIKDQLYAQLMGWA